MFSNFSYFHGIEKSKNGYNFLNVALNECDADWVFSAPSFADCAVVCGTQSVHCVDLKREDDTCIATARNSPFTRDERLTTHRLMPVEKVAASVATSPPLQTPPQQHNADITVGNFVLVRFALKLTEMNCRCRSCVAETMRIRYLPSRTSPICAGWTKSTS